MVGSCVGVIVGFNDGSCVGTKVGFHVGSCVGTKVGFIVGSTVGNNVGSKVGSLVGKNVGFVGKFEGDTVGITVGNKVGKTVGKAVGENVGILTFRKVNEFASGKSSPSCPSESLPMQRIDEAPSKSKHECFNPVTTSLTSKPVERTTSGDGLAPVTPFTPN